MTNEVKIVPKLRFPGFESNWKEEKIKTLFKVVSGTTPLRSKKEYFDKAEVPWVKTTDLNNNVLRITDEKISNIAVKEGNMRILPENTLLIAMYGGFNQIGRTGIISFKSTINQAISALLDIEGKSDVNYLQAYFNYNVQKWKRLAASSRKDPNITKKDVENFKITIPTLEEQKRMGEFFSKLDQQIELEEQKLEKLEEQKKGYMQKIFSQELRFKDENGNDYPEWEIKKLMQIAKVKTGSKNVQDNIQDGKYKFFDRSVEVKYLNTFDFDETAIIYPGEGSKFLPRYFSGKYSLHQRAYSIYDININNNYLYYYLSLQNNHFLKYAVGSTVKSLRMSGFDKLKVMVPKNSEQEKIGSFFKNLDEFIEKQANKVELLKQRKQSFLQKMFV